MRLSWTLASALLCSCSPFGGGAFTCETSGQCMLAGTPGMCQPTGMCSYSDSSCLPSGQRYGGQAGSLSGSCVGDDPLDGSGPAPIDIAHDTIRMPIDAACDIEMVNFCASGQSIMGMAVDSNETIDTDHDQRCTAYPQQDGGPDACLIIVSSLAISHGAKLSATGNRPLIIASSTTINIAGELDVSSHGGNAGAGATSSGCNTGAQQPTDNTAGASGGAGGTFADYGGDSGIGDNADQPSKQSAASKAGDKIPLPTFARGGCRGLDGGDGIDLGVGGKTGGGSKGSPGGSVWLYANVSIDVAATGAIAAGGTGGGGGASQSGGGGGGSGGFIRLMAATITVEGTIAANGGGGGQGDGNHIVTGANGDDAHTSSQAANGGNNGLLSNAGPGGNGSVGGQGKNGVDSAGGSGGGGGGPGFVVLVGATTVTGTISPPPT